MADLPTEERWICKRHRPRTFNPIGLNCTRCNNQPYPDDVIEIVQRPVQAPEDPPPEPPPEVEEAEAAEPIAATDPPDDLVEEASELEVEPADERVAPAPTPVVLPVIHPVRRGKAMAGTPYTNDKLIEHIEGDLKLEELLEIWAGLNMPRPDPKTVAEARTKLRAHLSALPAGDPAAYKPKKATTKGGSIKGKIGHRIGSVNWAKEWKDFKHTLTKW